MVEMSVPTTWALDVLPLKRRVMGQLWPEMGCLLPTRGPVVFLVNVGEPGFARAIGSCDRIAYRDFDALRADGWVVD